MNKVIDVQPDNSPLLRITLENGTIIKTFLNICTRRFARTRIHDGYHVVGDNNHSWNWWQDYAYGYIKYPFDLILSEIKQYGIKRAHYNRWLQVYGDQLLYCPLCETHRLIEMTDQEFDKIVQVDRDRYPCSIKVLELYHLYKNNPEFTITECGKGFKKQCRELVATKKRQKELDEWRHNYNQRMTEQWEEEQRQLEQQQSLPILNLDEEKEGFIYLIKCNKRYKIGQSMNPKARMDSLQSGNPESLELVKTWKVKDRITIEALLHDKYKNFHKFREWFELPDEIINELKQSEFLNTIV